MGWGKALGYVALGISPLGLGTKLIVGIAGEVLSRVDDADKARIEGFEEGFRKGEIENKKKFLALLRENDDLRLGIFAISVHVAKLDDLDDSEVEFIEKQIGRPDGTANMKLRERFQSIWENDMSFQEIKERFLNEYSVEILTELDDLIRELIEIDNVISDKERDFVDNVWAPYLKERLN